MKDNLPLPEDKKITVVYHLESGCLGPDGKDHIKAFCQFMKKEIEPVYSDFIIWDILPRIDIFLPEIQYKLNNKALSNDQSEKLLLLFGISISKLEMMLDDKIILVIEKYLGR